jgi:hypothetical protein
MTVRRLLRYSRVFLAGLIVLTTAGCRDVVGFALGAYTGPSPARTDITDEAVIVRRIYTSDLGGISVLVVDRIRFLEKDRHNINRLVMVNPHDLRVDFERLGAQVGDTLKVSTRFEYIGEASGESGAPDWPYKKYFDYPMGSHLLTKVERVGR